MAAWPLLSALFRVLGSTVTTDRLYKHLMTLFAFAEQIHDKLVAIAEKVDKQQRAGDRVVLVATVGKQQFRVVCEELASDRQEPVV